MNSLRLMSGTQYNIIIITKMVKYNKPANKGTLVRTIAKAALSQLIENKGEQWVIQQIQNGAIALSRDAMKWWAGSTANMNSTSVVAVPAPSNVGFAVRGNPKLNGATRFKHRELVGVFTTNSQFGFRVSPANNSLFPYLSTLANMYDEYRFHALRFVIVSATPTSTGGRWYMAWDPDSEDARPQDVNQYMAMQHSVSMSAWQSGELVVPPCQKRYISYFGDTLKDNGAIYVRNDASGSTFDLYVEYDVELFNPNTGSQTTYLKTGADSIISNGTIAQIYGPQLARPLPAPTARKFQLAAGFYSIAFYGKGTGLALVDWTIAAADDIGGSGPTSITQVAVINSTTNIFRQIAVAASTTINVTIGDTGSFTANRTNIVIAPLSFYSYAALADGLVA
jgi:hypothetical protein